MSSQNEKIKAVVDQCGCTRDEAAGELERRGYDVAATVKSLRASARHGTATLRKSVERALKATSNISGMDKKEAEAIQRDMAQRAELADQGWEEVGAKSKMKKELARSEQKE